jgi:hypothetical protein
MAPESGRINYRRWQRITRRAAMYQVARDHEETALHFECSAMALPDGDPEKVARLQLATSYRKRSRDLKTAAMLDEIYQDLENDEAAPPERRGSQRP